ncbi:MAG: hypothetical protein KKD05_04130 [Candidatus Omnitrophica bacterium]|nr:hypothetical protein [Candidatus Omnitrophota bacterium]
MNTLNTVFEVQIIPFLKLTWSSLLFWRTLSFSLLFLIFLGFLFKENIRLWFLQSSRTKHDKELFQLLDLLMPERKLLDLLEKLEKDTAYEINSLQFIDKFRASLKEQTRQYLTPKLKKASLNCRENFDELRQFMDNNFILFPSSAEKSNIAAQLMYPNPEIDGGGNEQEKNSEKFAKFSAELNSNITAAKKSYQKYRAFVKEIINI